MALNFKRSLIATAENEVRVFNEQMNTIKNYTDDRKILLGNVVKPGEMLVSSDHKFLFVISQEKSLVIFDIAQKTIETQIDHVGGVKCISEEKGILAIGGIKSLSFYSTEDFSLKHSIPITQECRGVSISSDASWAASIHKDGKLQKWNLNDYVLKKSVMGHTGGAMTVCIFPDAFSIATSGRDRKIKIWNTELESVDEMRISGPHKCLKVTSDNFIVSGGDSGNAIVWKYLKCKDYMAGKVSNKLKPIKYLTVTHDSKYLFVYDTSIRVFSLESKEEELKFPIKNEILITMAVSRNNQQFFASSEAGHIFSFPLHEENNIKVLDRIDKSVSNISISNDNRYIAATFNDRRVRLIDLEEQTSTYLQHEKIITGIIFSDDSNLLISSLQDSKLRIKTLDGSRTDTAIQAPKGEIKHIASTSDLFLTTCGERTINLWSMGNNSCVKTMHVGCDKISAALFSSDNEYIVIIADSDLQIWKINDMSDVPVKIIMSPHHEIISLAVLKKQNQFISVGSENIIKLWNFEDFTNEAVIRYPSYIIPTNELKGKCEISNDDKYLFTYSTDGIQIWSIFDLVYIGELPIPHTTTFALNVENDSFIVASGLNILKIANPTHEKSCPTVIAPFSYTFTYWETLKLLFSSKLDASYSPIMNQCVVMPQCMNILHVLVFKNELGLLENAMKNNCPFLRSSNGRSPITLALDTKNKECLKQMTRDIVLLEDPNSLVRLEPDILRLNKHATDMLPYFYRKSFTEPNHKLLKFAVPLKSPTNAQASISKEINLINFITAESRDEMRSEKDELLNFRVSKFRLNMTLGSNESIDFLMSIINCTEQDVLKTPFIQELLYYKWSKVQILLSIQAFLYFWFIVLLSIYTTALKQDPTILNVIIGLNFIFLIYEILQMTASAIDYFTEFWNIVDIIRIVSFIIYAVWGVVGMNDNENYIFLGCITFLSWIRAIAFFRVFRETRYLIRMIQEIISDMIPFLIVLIYSIFTFALVFCVLSEMSEQKTIEEAWRHSYLINYGEFDTDLYTWLEWVVFVMATCLNPLILMNMLIALMGDTYSRVKEKADVADLREMALFIFEFESILVWRREKGRKKYFQLCTVSELEDEEEMDIKKFWQDKITLLTQNVWRLHNEVTEMELKYESSNKSVHQGLEDINSNLKIKVEAIEKKMKSTQQELLDILNRTADR